MNELSCFKAYDIRGEVGVNIDEKVSYRVGRAVAEHFSAKSVVIGFDARATSPSFAEAVGKGVQDAGADVIAIGLAGTEEMYWAVTEFGACAGITITASHNPINFNGMKIVKHDSKPLDDNVDFKAIKKLAEKEKWGPSTSKGVVINYGLKARHAYVKKVLSFIDISLLSPLKIVVNSGNGAAGPTFDAIARKLSQENAPLKFIRIHHNPDNRFPNGIPNPILPQNHFDTVKAVKEAGADFGIAFDGDFDRCFFFDENGNFIQGEYIVGLLASIFLEKNMGAKIVHDTRVIWNTLNIVSSKGGIPVQSKTGHAFIKKAMRTNQAIYGGEISAHHYFQDFAFCDSGMIPWLMMAELISCSKRSLGNWVKDRYKTFPSSGEINFQVDNAQNAIDRVLKSYKKNAISLDKTDGVSLTFKDWRFNLRMSNTESLVRLNIESQGRAELLKAKVQAIANLIGGNRK